MSDIIGGLGTGLVFVGALMAVCAVFAWILATMEKAQDRGWYLALPVIFIVGTAVIIALMAGADSAFRFLGWQ